MPETKPPKTLRFPRPFRGHPAPVKLSGLFLFDPATLMKLYGYSMRGTLEELAGEAFYKKWERISLGEQAATAATGLQLLSKMPAEMPLVAELRAAFEGDAEAQQAWEGRGSWEAYLMGSGYDLKRFNSRRHFILAVERACAVPERLIAGGNIPAAAQILSADPVVSLLLWPEALELLNRSPSKPELLPLQASVALEVQLSCLAALDVEVAEPGERAFAPVLPSSRTPGLNPTSLYYRYLQSRIGVRSMPALLAHPKAKDLAIDMTTLKRWSAGTHHPDPVWLCLLVSAFVTKPEIACLMDLYWAAKNINLIGFLGQRCSERALAFKGTDQENKLRPWPEYPFGFADFEQWIEGRYPFWLDYHCKVREELSKNGEERPCDSSPGS